MGCSVLIVEDDARFREAFSQAVLQAPDLQLLGAAPDFQSGLALLKSLPDVLLVDLQLPDGSGIDLIRLAAHQQPPCDVMVVSVFGDERNVLQSIEAGATGYLLKDVSADDLVNQIRVLRAGGSPISPIIARQLLTRLVPPEAESDPLSPQEVRVLTLTTKGHSYDEIAVLMQISRHTVQTYVKRIYRKLQVRSKLAAVSEARRRRLIQPDT